MDASSTWGTMKLDGYSKIHGIMLLCDNLIGLLVLTCIQNSEGSYFVFWWLKFSLRQLKGRRYILTATCNTCKWWWLLHLPLLSWSLKWSLPHWGQPYFQFILYTGCDISGGDFDTSSIGFSTEVMCSPLAVSQVQQCIVKNTILWWTVNAWNYNFKNAWFIQKIGVVSLCVCVVGICLSVFQLHCDKKFIIKLMKIIKNSQLLYTGNLQWFSISLENHKIFKALKFAKQETL